MPVLELVRKQHAFSPLSCIKASKECTFLLWFPYGRTSRSHTPGPSLLSFSLTYHLCYPFRPHFLLSPPLSLGHVAFSPCRQLCDNMSTKPYHGSSKFYERTNWFQGRKATCFGQIKTTPFCLAFCLAVKGMLWSLFFSSGSWFMTEMLLEFGKEKSVFHACPPPLQS